ncbi:MAG: hypothetical protein AAGI10_11745 [Pseudomonadota bacterium]
MATLPPLSRPAALAHDLMRDGSGPRTGPCRLPRPMARAQGTGVCHVPQLQDRAPIAPMGQQPGQPRAPMARAAQLPPMLSRAEAPRAVAHGSTPTPAEPPFPAPSPGPDMTAPDTGVQGRVPFSADSALPLIEIVARGISGAAGYAFVGEDPNAAGVRFGMLGLRQDTGDMGSLFARAEARDPAAFAAALGPQAQALAAHLRGDAPKSPFQGSDLWLAPWKTTLMMAAATPVFTAAQNEHAVKALLLPAAEIILANPALADGAALAMALDVMAQCGVAKGLTVLTETMKGTIADRPAFQAALAKAVPASGRRFAALATNQRLVNWRPLSNGTP